MQNLQDLWRQRLNGAFFSIPTLSDEGLLLGAATLIYHPSEGGATLEREADRMHCLLSIATRQSPEIRTMAGLRKALRTWQNGQKTLAQIYLEHSRPRGVIDESAAWRLFLAEILIDNGLSIADLQRELFLPAVAKRYDPDQPRNPAGSGREAGRWTNSSSISSSHGQTSQTDSTAASPQSAQSKPPLLIPSPSLLQPLAPSAIGWLARMASRLAGPLAFFGATIVPDRNPGLASEGTILGQPDISYRIDHDGGTLRLTDKCDPDPDHVTVALLGHDGIYREVDTGLAIARNLPRGGTVIDTSLEAEEKSNAGQQPKAATDEPKLCPAPTKDKGGGRKEFDVLYQQFVRDAVNPQRVPQLDPKLTFALPLGNMVVHYDDCQESTGRMIDAKGHYAKALKRPFMRDILTKKWTTQGENQVDAARGRGIDWYFHEARSAAFAAGFFKGEKLSQIKIHVLPFPGGVSKPNPRIR